MKKSLFYFLLCFALCSCVTNINNSWTEEEKTNLYTACIGTALTNPNVENAESYCQCILEKSLLKYKNGTEADKEVMKLTQKELYDFSESCLNNIKVKSINNSKYKNVTSSIDDIDFYKLVEVVNLDENTSIKLKITKYLNPVTPPDDNKTIFQYSFFEEKTGYMISMNKLVSRNTQKLSDKQYLDITNKGFQEQMKGDLKEVERILSPIMKNVKVVQLDGNLIINDKYFMKRVSYFNDKNLDGTILENVTCTEFHYVTLHKKKKYSLNITYYGDDKSVSDVVGLFNTIGGSVRFD